MIIIIVIKKRPREKQSKQKVVRRELVMVKTIQALRKSNRSVPGALKSSLFDESHLISRKPWEILQ